MRYFLITILLLLPLITFAQYTPLVNVPMLGSQGNAQSLNDYVNAIYALSISIAALLAVIKIIIAGVKWMTTDIVTTKGQAKKDIQGAILGLLIIVGAVIIIAIINPNIGVVDWTPPAFSVSQPSTTSGNGNSNSTRPEETVTQNGGTVIPLRGFSEQERAEICENINPQQCNESRFNAHCYSGEVNGSNCLVSYEKFVFDGENVRCTEETDYTGEQTGYNCDEAIARCANAGYGYEQGTSLFGFVEVDTYITCTSDTEDDN